MFNSICAYIKKIISAEKLNAKNNL